MRTTYSIGNLAIFIIALVIFFNTGFAFALTSEPPSINQLVSAASTSAPQVTSRASIPFTFPIPALGNCASTYACKVYCDDVSHADACIAYAETNGFMSPNEARGARSFLKLKGPGNCEGAACKTYCQDPLRADECLAFARDNDLMTNTGTQSVKDNPSGKPGPGGCLGNECRAYCGQQIHAEECLKYAKDNSLMSSTEIDRALKIAALTAPGCKGIECKAYCNDITHFEECRIFAEQLNSEKKDIATSTPVMTEKPIGCTNREECEILCKTNLDAWGLGNKGTPSLMSPVAPKSSPKTPAPSATKAPSSPSKPSATPAVKTPPPSPPTVTSSTTVPQVPVSTSSTTSTVGTPPSSPSTIPPPPPPLPPPPPPPLPPPPTSMTQPTNYLAAALYGILQYFSN